MPTAYYKIRLIHPDNNHSINELLHKMLGHSMSKAKQRNNMKEILDPKSKCIYTVLAQNTDKKKYDIIIDDDTLLVNIADVADTPLQHAHRLNYTGTFKQIPNWHDHLTVNSSYRISQFLYTPRQLKTTFSDSRNLLLLVGDNFDQHKDYWHAYMEKYKLMNAIVVARDLSSYHHFSCKTSNNSELAPSHSKAKSFKMTTLIDNIKELTLLGKTSLSNDSVFSAINDQQKSADCCCFPWKKTKKAEEENLLTTTPPYGT